MNPAPDYSCAYVILRTDAGDGLEGHALAFTIGRGTDVQVAAIEALAPLVVGLELEALMPDTAAFWRRLAGDSQLRWRGPERGVMHMAVGAVVNAVWDLHAKREGKPLWKVLADMSPEELVALVDFRHLTDTLTRDEALEMLRERASGRDAACAPRACPRTRPRRAGSATPTGSCAVCWPRGWRRASATSSSRSAPTWRTTSAAARSRAPRPGPASSCSRTPTRCGRWCSRPARSASARSMPAGSAASTRSWPSCCWPPSSACRSARTPAGPACASWCSTSPPSSSSRSGRARGPCRGVRRPSARALPRPVRGRGRPLPVPARARRALYSASEGAVLSLTLAMAADHLREGIRMNCVNPGTADTPWVGRLLDAAPDPDAERAALEARQPMGRLVSAQEVAEAIVHLASPGASATTGTSLAVDGGMQGLRLHPRAR